MSELHDPEVEDLLRQHGLLSLFEEQSFLQRTRRVIRGLKQPKESGENKWARLQVLRLSAPACALIVPVAAIGVMALFAGITPPAEREIQVQVIEADPFEELEQIEDLDNDPIEPPEPMDIDFTPETLSADVTAPTPEVEMSPQPAAFDSVAIVKSPVIMKGIFGSRSGAARGVALQAYGGSGVTEGAVLRALRWLKKEQAPDGSWPKTKSAMTALALLTYLAHGETPASEEFGPTVERAIRYLVDHRREDGGWNRRYEHAICAYAICEAYALTKVPMLKPVAEEAIDIIIRGQRPTGGWRYTFTAKDTADDTSCMGWCAQALKAGKMAGIKHPQLDACWKKSIEGFKLNAHENGGFGYTSPGQGGLSGCGVLCMQLLGASKDPDCRKGLLYLDTWTFDWKMPQGRSALYYWYYITQAKFHAGGETWDKWNNMFAIELVKNQTILKDAVEGPEGKMLDIGFWDSPAEHEHTDGRVMDTCLSALQLQVYYRYLPTFKPPTDLDDEVDIAEEGGDIDVEVSFL